MTVWEIGVGLWSTAHFVSNSGGSRGGAWEAQAPLLFLDQTEAAPKAPKKYFLETPPTYLRVWMTGCPPPSLSGGLDPPLYNNVATTHLCLQSLACLVVLVEGKFYGISSLKIFD